MEPQDKALLKETLKLAQENNRLLRKMNRSLKWGRFWKTVYWVIVIGAMFGLYYFLQPVFENLISAYQGAQTGFEKTQSILESLPGKISGAGNDQ
jgi:hypothetical protein